MSSVTMPTHRSINVFNSTSKLQDFFGVDDIKELKYNKYINKKSPRNSLNRIKSVFNNNNNVSDHEMKIKKGNKKLRRSLNKLRKEQSKIPRKSVSKLLTIKLFDNCSNSSNSNNNSPSTLSIMGDNNITKRCSWRPSIKIILSDQLLLKTLTRFMEKCYNQENILFLTDVKALNDKNASNIDQHINYIYSKYIISNAIHQINLPYDCFMDILSRRQQLNNYNLAEKMEIFDSCAEAIERLMLSSILPSFYSSIDFQSIARQSKYYKSKHSPYSSLSDYSPIKIDMSHTPQSSTESFCECW